ncbi:MAG TPA: histidine kinase N-terminal 7TM domain-containing protein [Armatimonadota bacterium]|jgi:diguanylate cyclase (GGDEF)-like protein/PAS domain S-box-containing protein
MQTLDAIYLLLLTLATLVSGALIWATWQQRTVAGALPLFFLSMALAILSISSALEALAPAIAAKEFWMNVEYVGYSLCPVLYFLMVIHSLGMASWTTPRRLLLLFFIPAMTLLFGFTNSAHHLMRANLHLAPVGALVFLGKTNGPWFWMHIGYSFLLMVASLILLFHPRLNTHALYRTRTRLLMVGLLIPIISSVLYVFHISPSPYMDLTPAFGAVSAILIFFSVMRFRLFDIVPMARDQVVESMDDGMLMLDAQRRVVDLNSACQRMLALNAKDALGKPIGKVLVKHPVLLEQLLCPLPLSPMEFTLDAHGCPRYIELRVTPILHQSKQNVGCVALFRDITERKRTEMIIEHMAYHDRLTDLPNRDLFQEHVVRAIARAHRDQERLAILLLDLNGFKLINDTLGHHTGDHVLCEAAARLRGAVRECDSVCRLGGDEFVILQIEIAGPESTRVLTARIREALARPLTIKGTELNLSTSVGISLYPEDGQSFEELIQQADERMYADKRRKTAESPLLSSTETRVSPRGNP